MCILKHYKKIVGEQEIELATAKSEAIKEVLSALETSIEESDKYIREYEDSKEQRAYNQALRDAYNDVKEMTESK